MKKLRTLGALVTLFAAQSAFAHPGHDVASGAMAGLMHPLTGIDHLIALACVGAFFAMASARVRWTGVAVLLVALAAGAGIGLVGFTLPAAEWMIALSVLVAGVMLIRSGGTHPALLISGTAIFALFHGYAHGVESTGDAAAFVAGFLVASFTIVTLSMFVSKAFTDRQALRVAAGVATSTVGLALLSLIAF